MTNKGKVDQVLTRIMELEKLVGGLHNEEQVPDHFFEQSVELTNQIFQTLYTIEQERILQIEKRLAEERTSVEELNVRLRKEEDRVKLLTAAREAQLAVKAVPVVVPEPVLTEIVPEPTLPEVKEEKPTVVLVEKAAPVQQEQAKPVAIREEVAKIDGNKPALSLKEILERKTLVDLKKSFSLNDRFLFKKEIFNGDESKMIKVIDELNSMTSLPEAMDYLKNEMKWDFDNSIVADFVGRLEKRFL